MPTTRTPKTRSLSAVSLIAAGAIALSGCAAADTDDTTSPQGAATVTIEDNNGSHTIDTPPSSVVALDNRTFETLDSWGIELSAAAISLMPKTISYKTDEKILDIGTHNEPKLELLVAAEPTLVINGQRFTQHFDDIVDIVPDATVLVLDPRDGEPFDAELKRQTITLGEVFGKQDEAAQLADDLDSAITKAKDSYDPAQTVMAVTVSGGKIGYIAPKVGRTLGPIFDILDLTPALQIDDATDNHQGDDISVEAIAKSNPDWILVMDRDAAISGDDASYSPASEVLEKSEALANVSAVQNSRIVYMPADTYTNEGIQTYTEFLNDFATALGAK